MLTRLVNGERVIISIEEEDQIKAEWKKAEAELIAVEAKKQQRELTIQRLKDSGSQEIKDVLNLLGL